MAIKVKTWKQLKKVVDNFVGKSNEDTFLAIYVDGERYEHIELGMKVQGNQVLFPAEIVFEIKK